MGNATQTVTGVTVGNIMVAADVNGNIKDGGINIAALENMEGTGTVTSVSVAVAQGFKGTVANPNTTPAITIETSVTGLLKGNGTGVSAAVSGTDYQSPILSGTWASRPVSPTANELYFATDLGTGILLVYNGTKWKPVTGHGILANLAPVANNTATSETNMLAVAIPAGLLSATGYIVVKNKWVLANSSQTVTFTTRLSTTSGDVSGGNPIVKQASGTGSAFTLADTTDNISNQNSLTVQECGGEVLSYINNTIGAPGGFWAGASNGAFNTGTTELFINVNAFSSGGATNTLLNTVVEWIEN